MSQKIVTSLRSKRNIKEGAAGEELEHAVEGNLKTLVEVKEFGLETIKFD
jgi:hypothetical protein